VILALTLAASAQAPRTFDAASVKRNPDRPGPGIVAVTGRRISAPFVTLRMLVQVAYGVEQDQVTGGPPWIDSDHFEVNATAPAGASIDDVRLMLRQMLAERFGLAARKETREGPAYVLSFSGQFGPKMRRAADPCAPLVPPPGLNVPPPPPPPPAGAAEFVALGVAPGGSKCGGLQMNGYISARDWSMDSLVWVLRQALARPVIDRTGLKEKYDFDLMYLPDSGPPRINGGALTWDAPSLTTAVREQLGLKLDTSREPIDVIVIDRATPPTEN
jgi:uncharacterized protein (TIGR03435 family)